VTQALYTETVRLIVRSKCLPADEGYFHGRVGSQLDSQTGTSKPSPQHYHFTRGHWLY
jgi:hypothetical protein